MMSTRYHIATIIAVFLSLGVGIVIGGTLGQRWTVQAENSIVELLTSRYESVLAENQTMKKQIGSLELYLKTVSQTVEQKVVWWYRTPEQKEDLLAMVLNASGVHWVAKEVTDEPEFHVKLGEPQPDYILVSDPVIKISVERQLQALSGEAANASEVELPRLIDVTGQMERLSRPDQIVEFMINMKQLIEEESYAAANPVHIRDRAGVE